MKVGLYSITYLGIWYDDPALTIKEFIHKAKELGFDGIELDSKRPHANPMDLDQRARDEIREELEKTGLEIPAIASNNDFSSPVPEHRESQLLMVREQARLARDLGAKVVRLFAAWPGVTLRDGIAQYEEARQGWERAYPDVPRLARYRLVRKCLREAAAFGEEFGVVMALQNHPPIIRHYQDTLDLVREVDSPWLKVCLDAPLLIHQDDDWVRKAALATGDLQVHSHFGGEFFRDEEGRAQLKSLGLRRPLTNYPAFLRAMKEIGYEGYFCYEFCHPAVDENHDPVGIELIHEQAAMALEYMRDRIAELEIEGR
ncbi:MAG: sugar phosphate isomerase/epimerase family protein, partial [Chloroflexota bacterium]|nr:sugar phosphate isomerase/epimerase family protein [Chloroflexota bacterium]